MKTILGGLVLLAVIAALTNPDEEDFAQWMRDRAEARHVTLGALWRDPAIERRNYYVGSSFALSALDGEIARCYGALHALFVCAPPEGLLRPADLFG